MSAAIYSFVHQLFSFENDRLRLRSKQVYLQTMLQAAE